MWTSDGPSVVEITCAAANCNEATIKSNLANEGFPVEEAMCSGPMFMYTATLSADQLETAQSESFLETGFESCEIMSCSAPAGGPAVGICDGGAIYVSGYSGSTEGVNGMYRFSEEGQFAAYVNGDNAIYYKEGSWKLQTSDESEEMTQSSQMNKALKTGDFGQGIMISCDDAYNKLNEEKKKVAQLTEALRQANEDKDEAIRERENCRIENTKVNGEKLAVESDLLTCQQEKGAAETARDECVSQNANKIDPSECPSGPECPAPKECEVCDVCEVCADPECPVCPAPGVECPEPVTCPEPECPGQTCVDDLSSPIMFDNDYWFCDELTVGDCSDATHGEAVQNACRKLCGSCDAGEVCDEKYHTKVVIDGVGSIYCDQIYPEECQEFDSVKQTCCKTCKN